MPQAEQTDIDDIQFNKISVARPICGSACLRTQACVAFEICGSACLRTQACVAFEVFISQTTNNLNTCMWFTTPATQPLITSPAHRYYVKNMDKVAELFGRRALAGQDYGAVSNGYVLINEGSTAGSLPLSILADTIPELDEKFEVHLLRVEVASAGASAKYPPSLGNVTKSTVTILKNDNAFGMFTIISDSLSAVNNGHVTSVEEKPQLAVDLIVERQGGSLGTVTVDWYINNTASSAIYGKDYLGDGATLHYYNNNITHLCYSNNDNVITITVLDDIIPEENKTVMVQLRNPQGGAEVARDASVEIIILENDNVAGVLGFDTTSVLATEGDKIFINVTRKKSALGTVTVDWNIQGMNGLNPQLGFETVQGSFQFLPGVMSKTVGLVVLKDDKPEVNEEYRIHLTNIKTIGKLRVTYEVRNGSVSPLTEDLLGATMNQDFAASSGFIDIADGILTAPVSVQIRDDDLPEVDEVFIVTLTGVTLMDSSGSSMPPSLGQTGTTAQVIINANDGTKGVAIFTPDSVSVTVDEISKNITLAVFRDKGTFGNVSVFYYAQSISQGATPGVDFKITPQDLHFAKGEDRKLIYIEILNDDNAPEPEPDESFQVILSNPRNGLELGTPSRATVTILRNDGASGVVSFETADIVRVNEAGADNSSGIVQLKVIRGPGIFGVVNVPFEVVPDFPENNNDLSPSKGFITLQDRQNSAFIELKALDDNIPEQIERFTVRILSPDNEATLGNIQQKTVIINPNDSPNGLLQIYARGTTNNTIFVDENVGMLMFDIRRTQGSDGRITVDMATQPGTASVNSDLTDVRLAPIQIIPTNQVKAWFSFIVNQTVYMVMLTTFRVGDLTTGVGSNGSASAINVDRLYDSTLFKWQGELIPLQVANKGNLRRYQTKSRLYKVNINGVLLVVRNDHFVVFANSKDNNGETVVSVDVYKWDNTTKLFTPSPWQSLGNLGCQAVEVFVIEGVTYMAVANNYNSQLKTFQVDSVIYKLGSDLRFAEHQRIRTFGAVDVKHLLLQSLHLLVFANNRGDTISSPQLSTVYKWDSTTQMFFKHVDIKTNRVESIEAFIGTDNTGIYSWNLQEQTFVQVWTGPPASHMYPVSISQTTGALVVMAIASKQATDNATIYQFVKLKNSDFSPRTITMMFEPGERLRHTSVVVLQDDVPEDTEHFYITLSNPTGGAEIGTQNKITVNILSNDNAHGIIEIAPVNVIRKKGFFGRIVVKWVATGDQNGLNDITPLEGMVEFADGQSVATISLTILNDNLAELPEVTYIRLTEIMESGTTLPGRGAQIGPNNVATLIVQANDSPYGVVLWEKGQVMVSEPNGTDYTQVIYIVREQGKMGQLHVTYQTDRDNSKPVSNQAVSGADYVARQGLVVIQENVTRAPVEIVIKQDSIPEGDESFIVNITGVTLSGLTPPPGAEPSVKIPGNIIAITITENDNARGIVQFNVTTVVFYDMSTVHLKAGTYCRAEADIGRTWMQSTLSNVEGRVDSYEEYGKNSSISLRVSRTVGFLGAVTVTWQAEPREATVLDFTPSSGTIRLEDGISSADIIITILDDTIPEEMETFDVKLLSVTGGSQLGPANFVKVAILKNDSPNGLFRFVQTEVVIKESTTLNDPQGVASLDIERLQGTEGVVNVQWRLNAEAAYDFVEPLTDTVMFSQGENRRTITLRTKPDTILEGQERFIVSLITADNNADISHTKGDAIVIISPDPGASGTISILPQYRQLQIGEPGESSPSYNGQVKIVLTRGAGIYGDIDVTWSLTPRETTQFLQIEGTVRFVDLQQTATITLQAQDDTIPERPMIFTLQLNSATNGATISQVPGSYVSEVLFVASDYPHGLFEFTLSQITNITEDMSILSALTDTKEYFALHLPKAPSTTARGGTRLMTGRDILKIEPFGVFRFASNSTNPTVSELDGKVYLKVDRYYGSEGKVEVTYRSQEISATKHSDYFTLETNAVVMEPGQTSGLILVQVIQDTNPEEEEKFYINLTHVEKYPTELVPKNSPRLSTTFSHSVVTIAESNDPYGVLCLEPVYMTVEELHRSINLTIQRTGGIYGTVSVVVRTVGGGEPWTSQIAINPASTGNDTITQILSNRDPRNAATGGQDYEVLDTKVIFQQGEERKYVTVKILSDSMAEHEESVIVYLTQPTGGARIAAGSLDGGKRGFSIITIEQNDLSNGIIGFAERSKAIRVNEDTSPTFTLELSRINTIQNGQVEKPEGEFSFVIKLESVRRDAQLDLQSLYANITIESSDYYRGLFQFTHDTRMIVVSDKELQATVKVERQKGIGFDVDVTVETMQMTNRITDGSITVNPALETEDFAKKIQTLSFKANQASNLETVNIRLTPASKSISPYPKQFYIQMKNPTNGARTLADLNIITGNDDGLSEEETDLIEDILNEIVDEGQKRELPNQVINQALSVLCKMLNPNKNDATRGRSSLAEVTEKLAYAALFGKNCPTPQPPEVLRFQCAYAKMSAGRWLLDDIQSYKYQKNGEAQKLDTFSVPQSIPNLPIPTKGDCQDFHLIEYSSEQWFMRSDQTELLNNKVIGFGIKGRQSSRIEKPALFRIYTSDRRIATRRAQCVYYDMSIKDWVGGSNGICQVNNNLELGVDDYVDCSCYHMTHYGVKATSLDPGLVGYSVWFYIACFVCMICMALAILVHHICASLYTMFSANLLMHMCFACFATQSINFWKILVMNDEHTDRKYVLFFLIGWGLPVVLLAIFYVVTFNLYKYVYSLPVDFIYGDVNNNQEMCFITNPYAALGGILIPALLMLVLVIIVFVKAFQVTPQWQAYDDIYRGRYNIDEIRTLLLFWAVISFTWLWGGLHLVYGNYGTCVVLYSEKPVSTAVLWSWKEDNWERDSTIPSKSTMKVKRTLPSSGNIYVTPPVLIRTPETEDTDKDFDDLLFMLKSNGSYTASDANSLLDSDKLSEVSSKIDKYEMRRISIADTHL
ncbi:hypothetical protein KUTeg_017729 [Tegillarca granosa]|uniref:Calx-beta domain-containing protein n=1 Tax=Tegillarca granosa TaxID=220873 RepID=A0ABQ9EFS0_TEGGR|nr:hypothetical protein KUTeg_017729 [Tegillarca granosa]